MKIFRGAIGKNLGDFGKNAPKGCYVFSGRLEGQKEYCIIASADSDVFEDSDLIIVLAGSIRVKCQNNLFGSKNFLADLAVNYHRGDLALILETLDGRWGCIVLDKIKGHLYLSVDRLGLFEIYIRSSPVGDVCWSRQLSDCKPSGSVDYKAVNSFCRLGYVPGNNTWYSDVKLIEQGSITCFCLNGSFESFKQYYWVWSKVKEVDISFNDAAVELGDRLIESIRLIYENFPGKIGVSLSGGQDSRAMIAALGVIDPNYKGFCYTFGSKSAGDLRIARQVARAAGWEHLFFDLEDIDWLEIRLEHFVFQTNGFQDVAHMHGCEFLPEVCGHIDLNMNGFLGDVIAGGSWINPNFLNVDPSVKSCWDNFKEFGSMIEFDGEYFRDFRNRESALIANRGRRFTNQGILNAETLCEQDCPFVSNSILEFCYSLPVEYRLNNKLYSKMLLMFFPDLFRQIEWQKTGRITGLRDRVGIKGYFDRLRYFAKRKFRGDSYGYMNYFDCLRNPKIRNRLIAEIEENINLFREVDLGFDMTDLLEQNSVLTEMQSRSLYRLATIAKYFNAHKIMSDKQRQL